MDNAVDIAQMLGRVEGKVDLIVTGLTEHVKQDDHRFEHLNKRVDGLRNKWAFAAGAAAVVTFLVTNYSGFQSLLSLLPK